MPTEPRTGPEQLRDMSELVDSSQAMLDRHADKRAEADRALAGSGDHRAEMARRMAQDGTP